jgi:hypothetical protein
MELLSLLRHLLVIGISIKFQIPQKNFTYPKQMCTFDRQKDKS